VFSKLDIDENTRKELMEILKIRMVPKPVKIRADFKLTCYKFEGIDAIKAALLEGEKISTQDIPIKFRVLGSPIYECTTETINKAEGIKLMGQALKIVENSIRLREGHFLLQTKPTVLGDSAEKGIQEQMIQMQKKEEIDEEESEEDHEEGIKANIEEDALVDEELKITAKKKNEDSDDDDI
jgi:translation initiation factor 2 subunit 1